MKCNREKVNEILVKGFTIVEKVIKTQDEVNILKNLLQQAIVEDLEVWKDKQYLDKWMVHNLMTRGIPFAKLLENELMHSYLSELISSTCILYAYTSSTMPPLGTNYSNRIHVDCPRVIQNYITNIGVMIALDDFTPENGATFFLPYSQHQLQSPTIKEFEEQAEQIYPQQGDAVIFNARTWHKGGMNRTQNPRHAITLNACRSYMRQRFDYPRLVSPHIVDFLGETGKRFLGFNVRVPTSLEEYYLPKEKRLYKANQG